MQREASTTAEYTLLDQQLMSRATRYFAWQARIAKPHLGRRVIEAGCGTGNFTLHLTDRELVVGMDVVEECVERTRARFAGQPNMQFRNLDVQDPGFLRLKALRPDSIVCFNVLEHVRDDRLTLEHMHQVLIPGGGQYFCCRRLSRCTAPSIETWDISGATRRAVGGRWPNRRGSA